MKKDTTFDFSAYVDEEERKRVLRKKRVRRQKINEVIRKITTVAREGLEIYSAVKSKDPVSVGLGILSGYGTVYDTFAKDKVDVYGVLADMGLKDVAAYHTKQLVYNILRSSGLQPDTQWRSREDEHSNAKDVVKYDLGGGVEVFFVNDNSSYVDGPYVRDEKAFSHALSDLIDKKIGRYLVLKSSRGPEGWERSLRIEPVKLRDDVYISHINEAELLKSVRMFFDKGLNRSLIFYGPQGSGKTTLALRLTKSLGGKLLVINGWSLSGRSVGSIFDAVKIVNPEVTLFDDLDRINGKQELLSDLEEMNAESGLSNRLFIATVNSIKKIPKALRRPGRFDQSIRFFAPDIDGRSRILEVHAENFGVRLTADEIGSLAAMTEGMTGAYLREVIRRVFVVGMENMPAHVEEMKAVSGLFDKDDENDDDDDDDSSQEPETVEMTDECEWD